MPEPTYQVVGDSFASVDRGSRPRVNSSQPTSFAFIQLLVPISIIETSIVVPFTVPENDSSLLCGWAT